MLPGAEEEQLVLYDGSAHVEKLVVHILGRLGSGCGEQRGTRHHVGTAEYVGAFAMEVIRAGLGYRIKRRPDSVAEFRGEAVVDVLNLGDISVRERRQTDTRAVALCVVAAVDLIIDAIDKPVYV